MPRFYLRRLRAGAGAHGANGAIPARTYTGVPTAPSPVPVADGHESREAIAVSDVTAEDVAAVTGLIEEVALPAAMGTAAETAEGAQHRRRRRGRRGRGHGQSETAAGEVMGVLPGEPALPPETVEYDESYVPHVPPSSHLAEMVQSGGLVLPERGYRRRRGGGRADAEGAAPGFAAQPQEQAAPARPAESFPAARGPRERMSPLEEMVARQNLLFDQLLQRQTAMLKATERMMTVLERRGGLGGGAGGGSLTMTPRTAVFVDVPNIVYAAERIGVRIDWGKMLHWLTRDRQLVRATAYAPVSDDSFQRLETQKFVEPFYNLPYRILTKPLKRFGNGEIKANFDVELAIDAITMADRLDIICLVSGDGDFRRMVEIVQAKGVRVEVVAFSSSTAGELRTVCDDYIDISQHLAEFSVTR